jgi:hypothetical protein
VVNKPLVQYKDAESYLKITAWVLTLMKFFFSVLFVG